MDFSGPSLFASLVIGSVGLVLFVYGKRMERYPQLVVGAALMIYPYFVSNVTWMIAIAVALVVGLKFALSRGL
ncbi:MAG: hypothetical protein SGI72_11990 [Planctomycetota bacterium]|nr:hypothetical protein [Planctomycetota bacterium]